METRGGSARPGQFTSDKSSGKPGTGLSKVLFGQKDAAFVRRPRIGRPELRHLPSGRVAVALQIPLQRCRSGVQRQAAMIRRCMEM